MMSELQKEIAGLSLEDKAARLAEVYEDLDLLVKRSITPTFIFIRTLIEWNSSFIMFVCRPFTAKSVAYPVAYIRVRCTNTNREQCRRQISPPYGLFPWRGEGGGEMANTIFLDGTHRVCLEVVLLLGPLSAVRSYAASRGELGGDTCVSATEVFINRI